MVRFTIRDMLWLMAVVGLACAWFLTLYHDSICQAQFDTAMERVSAEYSAAKFKIFQLEGQLKSEEEKRQEAEERLKTKLDWRFPVYYRD